MNQILLKVQLLGHGADLVKFLKTLPLLPTNFNPGHHLENNSQAETVQRVVVAINDVGSDLHTLTDLDGLQFGLDEEGGVEQFVKNEVSGPDRRTNLISNTHTRYQYCSSIISFRTVCSFWASFMFRDVRYRIILITLLTSFYHLFRNEEPVFV